MRTPMLLPPMATLRPLAALVACGGLLLAGSARQEEIPSPVRAYFRLCDQDRNGWISFREARQAMELDRREFAVFDTDRDGRVTLEEFQARHQAVLDRGGVFPVPKQASRLAPVRDVDSLLAAYDRSGDRGLQPVELGQMLHDHGRQELELGVVFGKLDRDGSGALHGDELDELLRIVATLQAAELVGETPERPKAASVEELFGPYAAQRGGPVRAAGPLPLFRRLDLDGNGAISAADLRGLSIAPPQGAALAALAALDRDADGAVSREEFLRGMASGAR